MNQFGRRNLSAGERSILALRLEPILSAKAKERMLSGKKIGPVPKSAQGIQRGKVRDQVAKLAGVGHTTIQETKQILEHGTPEQVERMKRGGKGNTVNAVFNLCRKFSAPHTPTFSMQNPLQYAALCRIAATKSIVLLSDKFAVLFL